MKHCVLVAPENSGMANQLKYTNHILRKSAESVAVVGVPANNQMKSSLRSNVGGDANIRHSQHLRETNLLFIPRFRTFGRQQSLQRNTKDFKGAKPLKEI
jgi:ABC-type proline/glycine betaine transport system ATPase subunit